MHAKKLGRWLKMIIATFTITALIGFTVQTSSQAVSPNPVPVCNEGTCVVTFDYTGDYYTWVPPTDISSLHFDVYGAQGGRNGGKGGSVNGDFSTIPTQLLIYVGGAGSQGNYAPGGFNGGGISGSTHGDNGSGGGASDIRTSVSLSDRVVVAGGGGGFGGWIGGAGAPGGLTIAATGTQGAATTSGGTGGTQSSGGTRGVSTSISNATDGTFGVGGNGGYTTVAGGGGGGGGYFGGGGGGADNQTGGLDGAGGGGGSSYTTLAITSNVIHQAGVRSGNGQIVLSYTFAPKVRSFTPSSTSVTTANPNYSITFNQLVSGLTKFDFTLSGTAVGCTMSDILGNGYTFTFSVTGCGNGTLMVSLHPHSVSGSSLGPISEVSAESSVAIDNVMPGFTLKAPPSPSNATSLNFVLTSDEPFQKPLASAFAVTGIGCVVSSIDQQTTTSSNVSITGCTSGAIVSVRMLAKTVADLSGNLGPTIAIDSPSVNLDLDPPQVSTIMANPPSGDLTEYLIVFDEPVTGVSSSTFTLAGVGCSISKIDGTGTTYNVWLAGCTDTPTLGVKALAVTDAAGNLGPTTTATNGNAIVDKTAPAATVTEVPRSDRNASPTFEVTFNEKISGLTIDSFTRSGTAKDCTFNLVETLTGRSFQVQTLGCTPGTLRLTLPALAVTDLHSNAGPLSTASSPLAVISPKSAALVNSTVNASTLNISQPVVTPTPSPIPTNQKKINKPKPITKTNPWSAPAAVMNNLGVNSWMPITIAIAALAFSQRRRKGTRRETTRR